MKNSGNEGVGYLNFQYFDESNPAQPRITSGLKFDGSPVAIQLGMPIPRVGEIVHLQLCVPHGGESQAQDSGMFVVLQVHYQLVRNMDALTAHQEPFHQYRVTVLLGDMPATDSYRKTPHIRG